MRRLVIPSPPEVAPPISSWSSEHATSYANFDSNMVIILLALFCTLILVVALNSIVRCTLRCCRRHPALAGLPKPQAGLRKCQLRKIPVEVYRKGGDDGMHVTECPICLSEYTDGERYRVLPVCRHRFHIRCIDTWFQLHATCPTCRRSLFLDQLK